MRRAALLSALALCALAAPAAADVVEWFNRFSISSASMEPNLFEGDIVAGRTGKLDCPGVTPAIGDVVVILAPAFPGHEADDKTRWIKRVVAGPGDTAAYRRGKLLINGRPVKTEVVKAVEVDTRYGFKRPATIERETLASGVSYLTESFSDDGDLDNTAVVKIAPGHWFLLGDSRDNAVDSRVFGPVATADICGVITTVVSSATPGRAGTKP